MTLVSLILIQSLIYLMIHSSRKQIIPSGMSEEPNVWIKTFLRLGFWAFDVLSSTSFILSFLYLSNSACHALKIDNNFVLHLPKGKQTYLRSYFKVELTLQVLSQENLNGHLRELHTGLIVPILFSSLCRVMDLPSWNIKTKELSDWNDRQPLTYIIWWNISIT